MEENKKNGISLLVIGSIILVIAIIAMLVYGIIKEKTDAGDNQKVIIDTNTGEKVDPELLKVYNMEEYERIRYYFNTYITYVEKQEYQKAYNLLDQDFKNTYFKTVEEYKKYVQKKYPTTISVSYDGVIRLGQYYVLNIKFIDIFNSTDTDIKGVSQKFIIYEKNYNDFIMSFQAE